MCPFLTHLTPSLQQISDIPEQKMEIPILSSYFLPDPNLSKHPVFSTAHRLSYRE
jgi:hypothetical protein